MRMPSFQLVGCMQQLMCGYALSRSLKVGLWIPDVTRYAAKAIHSNGSD